MKSRLTSDHTKRTLALLLLAAGVLFQAFSLVSPARSDLLAIWKTVGQPGLWRSANFSGGLSFANYVRFLVEAIPADARVVLPAEFERTVAANQHPGDAVLPGAAPGAQLPGR